MKSADATRMVCPWLGGNCKASQCMACKSGFKGAGLHIAGYHVDAWTECFGGVPDVDEITPDQWRELDHFIKVYAGSNGYCVRREGQ